MIVDVDFLDHWKTRLAVNALGGDELAPLYILRIWAHCQARKKPGAITISTAGLHALCRCTSASAEALEAALIEAGFIAREGDDIRVVDWAARNKKLVSAWENGEEGGRAKAAKAAQEKAKREAIGRPSEPEPDPNENRTEGDGLPIRDREDKEEKQSQKQKPARAAQPAFDARAVLLAEGVDAQTAADWLAHRKAKRATATATVIEDRKRACLEAGVELAAGLALEVARGWQGLQAEWIRNALTSRAPQLPYQSAQDRARGWAEATTGAIEDDRRIIDITPAPTAAPRLG